MNNNTVSLIGWYGGDKAIARAAWTSTSIDVEAKTPEQIRKLIVHTLWNNESGKPHKTPFERGIVEFNITCEQASHIHLLKHRLANINGESARYKELKEDRMLIPEDFKDIYISEDTGIYDDEGNSLLIYSRNDFTWDYILKEYSTLGNKLYHQALKDLAPTLGRKRAKESARFFKTMNSQLTLSVMMNMSCFHNFYTLRADEAAQKEIREIAEMMIEAVANIEGNPFQYTLEAFGYEKEVIQEEPIEEYIVSQPIIYVTCKKGFIHHSLGRTASIRTHEYNKAMETNCNIKLYCEEYEKSIILTPEELKTKLLFISKKFGVAPNEYQLYNYSI